jgi:myo-inositol-1(or 4)-monophosphatase
MSCAGRGPRGNDLRAETAAGLAQFAGKMALERFESAQIAWKDDDSMVTNADIEIQAWLDGQIGEAFPEDGLLGEEGLPGGPRQLDARHVWVLDPIDGTNNFGRGMPGFCVSIGILRDGMPFAGAVYDPIADQLFTAWTGGGAWLNQRRLQVRPTPLSARSLFSIRSPYDGSVPEFTCRWLTRYRLRRFGSTALQLCYVALGGLAFVYDHGASLWDIAGAAPVVLEAGGVMTAPDGGPIFPVRPDKYGGEPLAFLAGDPFAQEQSLLNLGAWL